MHWEMVISLELICMNTRHLLLLKVRLLLELQEQMMGCYTKAEVLSSLTVTRQ